MPGKYLYLLVDILCLAFPLLFSFHKKIRFYRQWRYFALPCLTTAAIFISWDVIFTAFDIWSFNPRYVTGHYICGLPVEEILFFFCIPYACVFTYYAISRLVKVPQNTISAPFSLLLAALLIITAIIFFSRLYTSVTFLLLALVLIFLVFRRVTFLSSFYVSYLIILIPFYISNGVLTGAFTPEPVVSYNNAYNLGIRTLTIPIEDIFYGMALLLLNVAGYEFMKAQAGSAG